MLSNKICSDSENAHECHKDRCRAISQQVGERYGAVHCTRNICVEVDCMCGIVFLYDFIDYEKPTFYLMMILYPLALTNYFIP